jgi:hypothetical protein
LDLRRLYLLGLLLAQRGSLHLECQLQYVFHLVLCFVLSLALIPFDLLVHFGETKTWYGVPGDDYLKFEAAIKAEAPDLFEQQPALLYQLVTVRSSSFISITILFRASSLPNHSSSPSQLMNPGRLKAAGVRVFSCDQRANEFVITFPKAYHAGFNHGMNYNEVRLVDTRFC